jgi:glycoside/pentoside/hexuronide:cation symporter, GPH family
MQSLGFGRKLLYSTGDLTTALPLTLVSFFQLYFLTDVAGLSTAVAGWIILVAKVWDAVNDPLFGVLADRIRSRWGRRRGPLVFSAVPLGITFALMWIVPGIPRPWLPAYYALALIAFDTCFTVYHVSYNSLTPALARDYDEASSLNGVRMVFQLGGVLASVVLLTVAGWFVKERRLLYTGAGIVLGILSAVPPFLAFAASRGADQSGGESTLGMRAAMRATLSNRPFLVVMGTFLLSWTSASMLAAVLVYFANYWLAEPGHANYLVLAAEGAALLFIPLMVLLARRLDKRRAYLVGAGTWIAALAGIFFVPPHALAAAYALAAACGVGIATAYVIPWAMIPDVVDHDELATNERREGSHYAFASFFQKLGTGLALWLMGQALTAAGYVNPTDAVPLPAQPPGALLAIRLFLGPAPILLLAVSLVVCWRYPITREVHAGMKARLEAARAERVRSSG